MPSRKKAWLACYRALDGFSGSFDIATEPTGGATRGSGQGNEENGNRSTHGSFAKERRLCGLAVGLEDKDRIHNTYAFAQGAPKPRREQMP